MSAGASEMTIFWLRLFGESNPEFFIAADTRSRDSSTALSGNPTIVNACNPDDTSTSHVTICADRTVVCALNVFANDTVSAYVCVVKKK
jgi:hypothetical protein